MHCSSLAKLRIIFQTATTKIADVATQFFGGGVRASVFEEFISVIEVRAVRPEVCNFATVNKIILR